MKELVKHIQSFAHDNGKDTKQVLSDLLQYIIGFFNPEREPNPLWPYKKEQNAELHAIMAQYIALMQRKLATKEWFDAWGDLFMELTPKGGYRGQFFTPVDLCTMMADITVDTSRKPETLCNGFGRRVIVSDPTCGSGRNLLAAHALFIRDEARKPYLVAEDIDLTCCRMTAVNMLVHGCFGEVVCHNTLTEPKSVHVGFIVNEGLYPLQPGVPTIRISRDPLRFVSAK